MTHTFLRELSRLTIVIGLAVSFTAELPAQTLYGPFRITAGRWHNIGLHMKKGEYFHVQSQGVMKHYNVQFGPDGYQQQNGGIAGKLNALSGSTTFAVGSANGAYAVIDGYLEMGVLFAQNINDSDAHVTEGAFNVWVTAPANRCQQANCGFSNTLGSNLPGGTPGGPPPGNVVTWSPYMQGIMIAGYQLAIAEVGAVYGSGDALLQYVDGRLRMAHSAAVSGPIDPAAIVQLINSLAQTRNAKSMTSQIADVMNRYEQGISRHCRCNGIATNPAWVFNAGRQLAYVEAATSQNWNANTMYSSLSNLRTACINAGFVQVTAIDAVMQALRVGYQPNNLPSPGLNAVRNQVFGAADQKCVCY